MQRWGAVLAVAGLAAVWPMGAQTVATGKREILAQSDSSWNGKSYGHYADGTPELTVIKLTIAPHTALPWHTHPFPNAGYVLSGQLTITDRASGKKQTFNAGQAFTESVNDVHRGMAGDQPTVVILTYAGIKGKPTSSPAPGEKPEY